MVKPKVSIGSLKPIQGLRGRSLMGSSRPQNVTVWNEGVFRLNDSFSRRLVRRTPINSTSP